MKFKCGNKLHIQVLGLLAGTVVYLVLLRTMGIITTLSDGLICGGIWLVFMGILGVFQNPTYFVEEKELRIKAAFTNHVYYSNIKEIDEVKNFLVIKLIDGRKINVNPKDKDGFLNALNCKRAAPNSKGIH